jgi:hypothetical protein
MNVIIIQDNLAIPVRNIDYVKLIEDRFKVELCTRTMGHMIPFDNIDEALEFYNTVVEAMENLNK